VPDIYPADFAWTQSHADGVPVSFGGQHRRTVLTAGPGRTEDMAYDELVLASAEAGLRRLGSGVPFLLVVSFTGPHYPFQCPQEYWDRFEGVDIPLPHLPAGFRDGEPQYVGWLRHYGGFEEPVPDVVCGAARRAIYGRIHMVDEYFARLLAALDAAGAADRTIVSYTSDHGDMMGEHALWYKNCAYDWSARVPWILAGPGLAPGRIAETVGLLDLGPTLAGLAGIKPLDVPTDGRDLSKLLRGGREPRVGDAIFEYYGEGVARGLRTIVRGPHKLTCCPGTEPALFDLSKDPGEWHNLAADPAYREVCDGLQAAVTAGWGDAAEHDRRRWESERRRLEILRAEGPDERRWRDRWQDMAGRKE
jgi:choline-sulfatase